MSPWRAVAATTGTPWPIGLPGTSVAAGSRPTRVARSP